MLNRIQYDPIPTNPVSTLELMQFCATLDPEQEAIIESLGLAACSIIESYLDRPITTRSVRWVASRGETEKTDAFFRAWLSSRTYVSNGWNCVAGQWVQFLTPATSVQSVSIGVWGMGEQELISGQDYVVDLTTNPARMTFTYNLYVQDYFTNYDHMICDYTTGWDIDKVPVNIKTAIKIICKKMFENRDTQQSILFDNFVSFLLENYRNYSFGGSR